MSPQSPIRSCIGCRQRRTAAELLRIVAMPAAPGGAVPSALPVVPDPRRRMPGRGAWLHPGAECVDLAQRRRAFARALRVSGQIDPAPVREYVTEGRLGQTASGTPQEMKSNEHSMKRQQ
ncbi:MAG: YlxR family protein [Jatrophihabitans sp.]